MNPIEQLTANGYFASDDNGRPQIEGGRPEYYSQTLVESPDKERGAYFGKEFRENYRRDLTPSVAVLEFTVSDESPLAIAFARGLVKLLAPSGFVPRKQRRPLVRTTATSVEFLYCAETHQVELLVDPARKTFGGGYMLFQHGFEFPDAPNQINTAQLHCTLGKVFVEGAWLNDRSPLNTPRADLPIWDRDDVARKLRMLVDRVAAAVEIIERDGVSYPVKHETPEDALARLGVRTVYSDNIPPMRFNDERLQKSAEQDAMTHAAGFWLNEDGTPDNSGGGERYPTAVFGRSPGSRG